VSATITVTQIAGEFDPLLLDVSVRDVGGETRHRVTLAIGEAQRLGRGRPAEELVEAGFRFLLDREPKEAILKRFDFAVIGGYFPEFEARLPDYLGG
jgi:hypothetical protein